MNVGCEAHDILGLDSKSTTIARPPFGTRPALIVVSCVAVQLFMSRIGNQTRLIHTMLKVLTMHPYVGTEGSPGDGNFVLGVLYWLLFVLIRDQTLLQSLGVKRSTLDFSGRRNGAMLTYRCRPSVAITDTVPTTRLATACLYIYILLSTD